MKEQTKDKLKNYAAAVPLVGYAAGRLLVEEIIPEKVSNLLERRTLGRAAAAGALEIPSASLIETWDEFTARKAQERQQAAPQLHLVEPATEQASGSVISLDEKRFAEPPTEPHPIAA